MLFSMQLKTKQVKFELRSRNIVQLFRWGKNIFPRNNIRGCYYQTSLGFAFSFIYLVLSFLIILSTMKNLPTSCVVLSFRANLLQNSFTRKPKLAYTSFNEPMKANKIVLNKSEDLNFFRGYNLKKFALSTIYLNSLLYEINGNRIFLFIKKKIFLFIKKNISFNQKNISFHQKSLRCSRIVFSENKEVTNKLIYYKL